MSVVITVAEIAWRKMKYKMLSANTVTFISCRSRMIKVLAGASRGRKGNKCVGGLVRLLNVDSGRHGIEVQVDMPFRIGGGHGWRWHPNYMDGPAFLERELMGLDVYGDW